MQQFNNLYGYHEIYRERCEHGTEGIGLNLNPRWHLIITNVIFMDDPTMDVVFLFSLTHNFFSATLLLLPIPASFLFSSVDFFSSLMPLMLLQACNRPMAIMGE